MKNKVVYSFICFSEVNQCILIIGKVLLFFILGIDNMII